MCDSTFTFGQRGCHFFQCPSRREYARLPKKLARLLSSSQLKKIYHVTLGFEDSFLLTWRDTGGRDRVESSGLPHELVDFLHAENRNIPNIRCTLGPYNSSFLHPRQSFVPLEESARDPACRLTEQHTGWKLDRSAASRSTGCRR